MKFHRYATALFGALALAFLATGCTIPVMATGKYAAEDSGREDYAVVYQDKIFLHIKAPELYNGRASYWDWAGKYELTSAGEIRPDMDRETAKLWNFYYTFLSERPERKQRLSAALPADGEAPGDPVGNAAGRRRTDAVIIPAE